MSDLRFTVITLDLSCSSLITFLHRLQLATTTSALTLVWHVINTCTMSRTLLCMLQVTECADLVRGSISAKAFVGIRLEEVAGIVAVQRFLSVPFSPASIGALAAQDSGIA